VSLVGLSGFELDGLCTFAAVLHHLVKHALLFDELVRCPLLRYPAPVHHNDLVIVSHSDQPMGNGDDGGLLKLLLQHLLNEGVSFYVDVRGGLV